MRDAALTIAALGDDFAPTLPRRIALGLRRLLAALRRTRAARADLARLRRFDATRLDDLGLAPADIAGLDPALPALEATRRLAEAAARRRRAAAEDRWPRA